jgi:hypothetical protein
MGFSFNSRGFLMPYQKINSTLKEIEEAIFRIVEKYGYLKLDNYISQIFPTNHPRYAETLNYMDYWKDLFSSSRRDRETNLQAPRGFIEIIF